MSEDSKITQTDSQGPPLVEPNPESRELDLEDWDNVDLGHPVPEEDGGQSEPRRSADADDGGEETPTPPKGGETDDDPKPDAGDGGKKEGETDPDKGGEVEPDPTPTVSFEGFSAKQASTWKRLFESGAATAEEVETARQESMFHGAFTNARMKDKKKLDAALEAAKIDKDDKDLLEKIRGDDKLHALWMEMQERANRPSGDDADEDGDDLVSRKELNERLRREKKREEEAQARTAAEQKAYEDKKRAIQGATAEVAGELGLDLETLTKYLNEEEALVPKDKNPIEYFDPADLQRRIKRRHEDANKDARIAALEQELSEAKEDKARTSRQSVKPPSRVAQGGGKTALQETEEGLGVAEDWSNVEGFGWRPEQQDT